MANINIPSKDNNDKNESQLLKRQKKNYETKLEYERAFLKKKEELEHSSNMRSIKSSIDDAQKLLDENIKSIMKSSMTEKEQINEIKKEKLYYTDFILKKQQEISEAQKKAEYEAHIFATNCSLKRAETQNIYQRAQTLSIIADNQKIQAEKFKALKNSEIEELKSQKKLASSATEKTAINNEIKRIKREILSADKQTIDYQEQAAKYANIVKNVEFSRLDDVEKLKYKEKELANIKKSSNEELLEIEAEIAAKQEDLVNSEQHNYSKKSENLRNEIDELEKKYELVKQTNEARISEIESSIEGKDGYREKAENFKGTKVSIDRDTNKEKTFEDSELASILQSFSNHFDDFVDAFTDYVDAVENRVNILPGLVNTTTSVSSKVDTASIRNKLLDQLTKIQEETAGADAQIKSELSQNIDRLTDVLYSDNTNIDLSSIISSIESLNKTISDNVKSSNEEKKEKKEPLDPSASAKEILSKQQDKRQEQKTQQAINSEVQRLKREQYSDPEYRKENREYTLASMKESLTNAPQTALTNAVNKLNASLSQIDSDIQDYYQYQAKINARLQGTDKTYDDILDTLSGNLGLSTVVSQKKYIEKFNQLVDAGIAHNMETRAFIATVSENIASTFDAFDSSLLRLIRIQQNDSTAARLGLESNLNQLFNNFFSDSSYLSDSGPHDSITSAILEASSMMSNDMSVQFEYMVHKWLGSMYSLGFGSDTLNSIAQGLNYLGTGNISSLTKDESLLNLFAMSASRSGISLSDLLNNLDAEKTNTLLSGMVEYLREIASNTNSNQVVRSAYASVFGVNSSDLRAIQNLTDVDVASLTQISTNYQKSLQETQNQLNEISSRMHLSQQVDNLFENIQLSSALGIGSNAVTYGLWKALNVIEDLTGGIALPFVNIFGSGLDLNTTVTQLAKTGIAGISMLSSILSSLGSGGFTGGMDLEDWNNVEMTSRGTGSNFLYKGTTSGFSSSARLDYSGSGSTNDIKRTEMSDATDSSQEDAEITNKYTQEEQDVPVQIRDITKTIFESLAEGDDTLFKETIITNEWLEKINDNLSYTGMINKLLDKSRVFITNPLQDALTTSYSTASETVNTTSIVTSLFKDIVSSNNSLLNSNVDIWSLVNSVGSLDQSSLNAALKKLYVAYNGTKDDNYLLNFDGDFYGEVSNSSLISSITSSRVTNNSDIEKAIKEYAQIQQINKIVFPEYVRATIDDWAPAMKKYYEQLLKSAVSALINGTDEQSTYASEQKHPIVEQIEKMLTDPTTILHVEKSSLYR